LKKEEFIEYCSIIEDDIYGKNSEEEIVNILRFVSKEVWDNFKDLSKIKIEDMVLTDIEKCEVYSTEDSYEFDIVQNYGNIAIAAKHLLDMFSNKKEIVECIYEKLVDSKNNEWQFDFLIEKFFDIISNNKEPGYYIIDCIHDRLRYRNEPIWYKKFKKKLEKLPNDNKWLKSLAGVFEIFVANDDGLPF